MSFVDRAIILAGGRGTRLAPYTTVLPKPLMQAGEPVLGYTHQGYWLD